MDEADRTFVSKPTETNGQSVADTLMRALSSSDVVTHVFVIMAHGDGEVSITWSSMTGWQAKGLVNAGFDRVEEAFNPEEEEEEEEE